MSLSQLLLPEFNEEMARTRQVLQAVPPDKLAWQAHPKLHTIGWVMAHLAEIPGWVVGTLHQDNWDIQPVGGPAYASPATDNALHLLKLFDDNVAAARAALAAASDATLHQQWSLLAAGQPLFTMPRLGVIRMWVLNHTVHHRAILVTYLRLAGVEIPSVYGM